MSVTCRSSQPRFSGLLRDLAAGLRQQMFFWGKDVVHPDGNLLVNQGFQRFPSAGLQGTSCYRAPWESGVVELHGAFAAWYPAGPAEGGFLFIRPAGRCSLWLGEQPAVPGDWDRGLLGRDPVAVHDAAKPFLRWWLASEQWIGERLGSTYRQQCFRHFKKLPKSRLWLPPVIAMDWVRGLHDDPATIERMRRYSRH